MFAADDVFSDGEGPGLGTGTGRGSRVWSRERRQAETGGLRRETELSWLTSEPGDRERQETGRREGGRESLNISLHKYNLPCSRTTATNYHHDLFHATYKQ